MKTPSSRRAHGFTLVELLVVIAIIAVLAAAGFAAGTAAIQKAKKTTCLATATAIETAVNNFFTEYGSMPMDGENDEIVETGQSSEGRRLVNVLMGLEGTTGTILNTRGIKFLQVKEGKNNKNGVIYNTAGTSTNGLFDPWGGGYRVLLDLNYDERVEGIPSTVQNGGRTLNGRRVAVWSLGADGVDGRGSRNDDVITW